jgi:hypothetical protein
MLARVNRTRSRPFYAGPVFPRYSVSLVKRRPAGLPHCATEGMYSAFQIPVLVRIIFSILGRIRCSAMHHLAFSFECRVLSSACGCMTPQEYMFVCISKECMCSVFENLGRSLPGLEWSGWMNGGVNGWMRVR